MADYTPISMIRGSSTIIDSTPIVDGQILFDETRKCLFMDNGTVREKYSGLGADSNIANVEDTTTASQPYTTGEFVVVEGQLYKVTASIATGDTFSVGTNIETDTVGSELTKINADLSDLSYIVSKNGTTWYRIQNDNGTLNIWKSTDSGETWNLDDSYVSKSELSYKYVGYASSYNIPVNFTANSQDVYLEVNFTYLGASAIVNTVIPKAVLTAYGSVGRNIILGCGTTSQADRCSISLFVTSSSAQINYINVNGVEIGGNLNVYSKEY